MQTRILTCIVQDLSACNFDSAWIKFIQSLQGEKHDPKSYYNCSIVELKIGRYSYPNLLYGKEGITIDILSDIDPSQVKNQVITFDFTEQHRILLQTASIRWHEWDEECEGCYPTPGIDPKRPYGDRTWFELDMADALGMTYTEDLDPYFQKLHFEMQSALQVFLRYASLPIDSRLN